MRLNFTHTRSSWYKRRIHCPNGQVNLSRICFLCVWPKQCSNCYYRGRTQQCPYQAYTCPIPQLQKLAAFAGKKMWWQSFSLCGRAWKTGRVPHPRNISGNAVDAGVSSSIAVWVAMLDLMSWTRTEDRHRRPPRIDYRSIPRWACYVGIRESAEISRVALHA